MSETPQVGDIWEELDPRVEYQRCVRVSNVREDDVRIYAVKLDENGVWQIRRPAPERWAQRKRFNGRRGGYRLLERAIPETGTTP